MAVFGMKILQFREKVFLVRIFAYSLFWGKIFKLEIAFVPSKDVITLLIFLLQEFHTKSKFAPEGLFFLYFCTY